MNKYFYKLLLLFISIILFAIIYSFLDNSHFEGLNPIQDKLKEQEIEEKTEEIKDETEAENKIKVEAFYTLTENKEEDPEEEIQENVEKVAEEEKKKLKTDSFSQNFFDKLYFSIITACLVGYGDIYPSTNILKSIVSIQTLTTLTLILY